MKKFLYLIIAVMGVILALGGEAKAEGSVPLYRLYNQNTGEHLFTIGKKERALLIELGWDDEGVAWQTPEIGEPVYRLYYPDKFHLYTRDANEVKYLVENTKWKADNDGKPAFYSGGNVEIYRLYHQKTTRHLLTASKKEYDILSSQDWDAEGIGLFGTTEDAVTGAPSATVPSVQQTPSAPTVTAPGAVYNPSYVKGVWISFLEWQENLKGKNETDFKKTFGEMCDTVVANKCNTIYVHVRSHNDAVYPSAIYPWSTEMLDGIPSYNPLALMIEIAHNKGLSFQAWINPYGYRNGEFAGDPALVTEANIVAGIKEIVSQYNVDGIHFDDYFPDYDKSVHNEMIRKSYEMAHSYGKIFGVSPQGNISNNRAKGVDLDTWMSVPGYIDYIAPQIYWTDQYGKDGNTTMFSDRLKEWTALNKLNLPMYVGLATYRSGTEIAGDPGWKLADNNIATQIQKADAAGWDGYIHFRYAHLLAESAKKELANIK